MVGEKKKKGLVGKIVKGLGVVFLLIVAALIILPMLFKSEIKEYAFQEVNKALLADVDLGDLGEFTGFQIKIIMQGTNCAAPPRLKDLRILALAT